GRCLEGLARGLCRRQRGATGAVQGTGTLATEGQITGRGLTLATGGHHGLVLLVESAAAHDLVEAPAVGTTPGGLCLGLGGLRGLHVHRGTGSTLSTGHTGGAGGTTETGTTGRHG